MTLVASKVPSIPTSTTAASTASSEKTRKAAAVRLSNFDSLAPLDSSAHDTASRAAANSSSLTPSPSILIRSAGRPRSGLM